MGNYEYKCHTGGDQQLRCGHHGNKAKWTHHSNFWQGVKADDEGHILPQHIHCQEGAMNTKSTCNRLIPQHQGENEDQNGDMQD